MDIQGGTGQRNDRSLQRMSSGTFGNVQKMDSKSFDRSVSNPVKVYGAAPSSNEQQPRQSFKGYIEAEPHEYNGISNIKKKS